MIICAGESLVDVIPAVDPTQPDQAVPGGGPMNAAVAAARLGVPTAFVGRVSSDAYGDLIWSHLEASGVVLDAAQRGPEPTARAIVTTQPIQSFRFEGDNTADASMTAVDLGPLGTGPHILHAGTLGIFRGDTAHALRAMLDGFNGVVSFDPNIRPQVFPSVDEWLLLADPWLSRAAVVKASDEDLDWMGMKVDDVLARGAKVVFRTAGSAGVDVFLANGQRFTVQAKPVTVVDTVGAGDSFCGAVLARLHRMGATTTADVGHIDPDGWRSVVEYGVQAAAITIGRVGAEPPWLREMPDPN